ncbi:MAG TPA: SpoVR family protein [Methylomusa anaerophila]|uniref:SpoVR family protein n=1 Tax=Methylomusa anaerophila TaxID=1930071 RepID=A0A348AHK6_9FIRM|nr:SpoVR family protein [Methylomusa anaerophila]BBB90554.1 SpoVR family protein [Methylomusa anaerophila]HML88840.1 SpoVR family protein [Methylomusa anaerophila]
MTASYALKELTWWNEKIEDLVRQAGLDCYEQQFEICDYEDMLCYEAYVGMPSHYPHWSYGKAYERQKTFYSYNLTGLPYELVINSDPCIAYLMKDNSLLLQILTMAHVYGHNDFFKNNRLFKNNTRPELTVEMFKTHADRVRGYVANPGIGPKEVERILDAAHALRFQVRRLGKGKPPDRKQLAKEKSEGGPVPERLQNDLLGFIIERGKLSDWEKDLVNIVREETYYFLPQVETKIMNEGWASYWHYKLLNQLGLPQGLHFEFLQRHNMVVRPHEGRINPYFIGFKMFEYLDKTYGLEKILAIREEDRDQAFLRRYLNQELCEELRLFSYRIRGVDIVVSEVADEAGWKYIRDELANSVGLGTVPLVNPLTVENGKLVLEHVYDGRELEMTYAKETIKYVVDLWGDCAEIQTKLNNRNKVIRCGMDKLVCVWDM